MVVVFILLQYQYVIFFKNMLVVEYVEISYLLQMFIILIMSSLLKKSMKFQ